MRAIQIMLLTGSAALPLLGQTDWPAYGHKSGNPKCRDCMVHCGHEPTAVAQTFGSLKGFVATTRLALLGAKSSSDDAPPPKSPATKPHRRKADLIELPVLN